MSAPRDPLHAEIAALREQNDVLKAEVANLRALLRPVDSDPIPGLQLPPMQRRMLSLLVTRESISRECLLVALYGEDPPEKAPRTLDAHLSHLRDRLVPLGVVIENLRGEGWKLSQPARSQIQRGEVAASSGAANAQAFELTRLREENALLRDSDARSRAAAHAARSALARANERITELLFKAAERRAREGVDR